MRKVLAKCLKTYPNEDDMLEYCDGILEPCDVRINYKDDLHYVVEKYYNKEYYEVVLPIQYEEYEE